MKNYVLIALFPLLLTGCMTQAAIFPDAPSFGNASASAPIVGLASVNDTRADEKAGMIGALKIAAKSDAAVYLEGAIKKGLVGVGYNIVDAPSPEELDAATLEKTFSSNIIVPSIKNVSIKSSDAIMDPADAEFDFDVSLYNSKGEVLYQGSYQGSAEKRLNLVTSGKVPGEVLATAADMAVQSMTSDKELLAAITAN